jgi:hypothetical protein
MTITDRGTVQSATGTTSPSVTSGALTPATGAIYVLAGFYNGVSASGSDVTMSVTDTLGLTWTRHALSARTPSAGGYKEHVEIWTSTAAAGGSGTITWAGDQTTTDAWLGFHLWEVTDAGSVLHTATTPTTTSATSVAYDLGATPDPTSLVFSIVHADNQSTSPTVTPPAGMTLTNDYATGYGEYTGFGYLATSGTQIGTWSGFTSASNNRLRTVAIELAVIPPPPATTFGSLAELVDSVGDNLTPLRDLAGHSRAIAVEVALPVSTIGPTFIVGVTKLGGKTWYPVTGRWTGASIDRGSADGAANVGTATITLDNSDGTMSPWSTTFPYGARANAAPGTLVRITFALDGDAVPIITARVESWTVVKDGVGAAVEVQIVAVETTALLAGINETPIAAVGAGDTTAARITRLLDAAGWPYGSDLTDPGADDYTHQATTMTGDRLNECYLTATSAGLVFRADKWGHAALCPYLGNFVIDENEASFITADTLEVANDDDLLVNSLTLGIAGSAAVLFEDALTIARQRGRRSGGRTDLNVVAGTDLTPLARGSITLRPTSFEFDAGGSAAALPVAHGLDLAADASLLTVDGVQFDHFAVSAIHHELAPVGADDLAWTITVSLAPSSTSTVTLP